MTHINKEAIDRRGAKQRRPIGGHRSRPDPATRTRPVGSIRKPVATDLDQRAQGGIARHQLRAADLGGTGQSDMPRHRGNRHLVGFVDHCLARPERRVVQGQGRRIALDRPDRKTDAVFGQQRQAIHRTRHDDRVEALAKLLTRVLTQFLRLTRPNTRHCPGTLWIA